MIVATRVSLALLAGSALLVLTGCSALFNVFDSSGGVGEPPLVVEEAGLPGGDSYPDVLAVELRPSGDRTYDVAVTLSSPYDTPQRYADGWQVLTPEGTVLGVHTLLHDHATEQPFTRVQRAVTIPAGIERVTVQGRDQANGFGGLTVTVAVPE